MKRPDKGGGVVLMDKDKYISKLDNTLSDNSKFHEIKENHNFKLKQKINNTI